MNADEHLLSCLCEECAEVAQRATKAQRFGAVEIQPGQAENNSVRLRNEFADLLGVYELLVESGLVAYPSREQIEAKKAKVAKYQEYSKSVGTLT